MQVSSSSSSSPGDKLLFDIDHSDETMQRYKDQCRAELKSKNLKELQEIRQKAEESMNQGIMRYRAAYAASCQKVDEDCSAQDRLEALDRQLRHSRQLLEGDSRDNLTEMKEKLQSDGRILQQIKEEQADLKNQGKEQHELLQQTLEKQIDRIDSRVSEADRKIQVCQMVDEKILPEIQKDQACSSSRSPEALEEDCSGT